MQKKVSYQKSLNGQPYSFWKYKFEKTTFLTCNAGDSPLLGYQIKHITTSSSLLFCAMHTCVTHPWETNFSLLDKSKWPTCETFIHLIAKFWLWIRPFDIASCEPGFNSKVKRMVCCFCWAIINAPGFRLQILVEKLNKFFFFSLIVFFNKNFMKSVVFIESHNLSTLF